MFGKSRAAQAEKATREAEAAAQVAAEKALVAQQAQEDLYERRRARKRAERQAAIKKAKISAGDAVDTAREKARSTMDELKDAGGTTGLVAMLGRATSSDVSAEELSKKAHATASAVADRASSAVEELRSGHAADVARERSAHAASVAVERGGHAAEAARHWAEPRLEKARPALDRAREKGLEAAAPRVEHAAEALAPKIDDLRDRIVQDILPRITEAVNAAAASLEERTNEAATSSRHGLSEVATRAHAQTEQAKKKRAGGRRLLFLSAVGAAAAAAYAAWKSSQPSEDPWAVATAASQTDHSAPPRASEADAGDPQGAEAGPPAEPRHAAESADQGDDEQGDDEMEASDPNPFDSAPRPPLAGGADASATDEHSRLEEVSDGDTVDADAASGHLSGSTTSVGPDAIDRPGDLDIEPDAELASGTAEAEVGSLQGVRPPRSPGGVDLDAMEPVEIEHEELPDLSQPVAAESVADDEAGDAAEHAAHSYDVGASDIVADLHAHRHDDTTAAGLPSGVVYGGYEADDPDSASRRPAPVQARRPDVARPVFGADLNEGNRPAALDDSGAQSTETAEEMWSDAQEDPGDHPADVDDAMEYDDDELDPEESRLERFRKRNILPEEQ